MENRDIQEDEMWNSLAEPAGRIVRQKVDPWVRAQLEKIANLPPATPAPPTPFEQQHPEVVAWLNNYKGNFEFYLSVKKQYEMKGFLSDKQVAAIARAVARDKAPATPAQDFTLKAGDVLRLSTFLAYRIGEQAGINGSHFLIEITKVKAETAKAYQVVAQLSAHRCAHCCVCGRELTNEDSVKKGIGPICAGKYDLDLNSDKEALVQLSEKLQETQPIETWIPKSQIKERIEK